MPIAKDFLAIFKRDTFLYVTNILNGIFLARVLGPSALGIWGILTFITSFADGFVRTKADNAAVYFIGKKKYNKSDIYYCLNIIALVSSGIFILLVFINSETIYLWLFKNTTDNFRIYFYLIQFVIPIQFFCLNHAYFFIAVGEIKKYNTMTILQAISISFISILILFTSNLGLMSLIIGLFAGSFIALIYGIISIDNSTWCKTKTNYKVIIYLLKYSSNIYFASILGQLQQTGTMFFIVRFLAPSQIAFLNQGQALSKLINKISDPLSIILFPHISNSSNKNSVLITCKSLRILSIFLIVFGILTFMFLKPLILILYGEKFSPSILIARYLLPSAILSGLSGIIVNYFTGTGKAKLIPIILIIPILIQLLLAWILIPSFGVMGVIISINASTFIYFVILLLYFIKISNAQIVDLFPSMADLIIIYKFVISKILLRN